MVPRSVLACSAVLCAASILLAKDFWEQPLQKWKREDVQKLLTNSPWAAVQTFNDIKGGKDDPGVGGAKELFYKFTVRFFSALPVREAYVRMMQIMNKYDDMGTEERQQFDTKFKKALALDVSDRVIVAVEYATNDPNVLRDLNTFFSTAHAETLKQQVYLISQRLGRVQLKEYFPPSPDGTGAKLFSLER